MATKAELNKIASTRNTIFGKYVPEPLVKNQTNTYNPLRRAVQLKLSHNQSFNKMYKERIRLGSLTQESYNKYLKLISNNDETLTNEQKARLTPNNVYNINFKPRPPKTRRLPLKPRPPSYSNPKKMGNLKQYLKGLRPENNVFSDPGILIPNKRPTRKNRFNLNLHKNYKGNSNSDINVAVLPQRSNRSTASEPARP